MACIFFLICRREKLIILFGSICIGNSIRILENPGNVDTEFFLLGRRALWFTATDITSTV
jgi:hypothetical protein